MGFIKKEDWIINNLNVFGLSKHIDLALSAVQYEIYINQIGNKELSLSELLSFEINTDKIIPGTRLSIKDAIVKIEPECNFAFKRIFPPSVKEPPRRWAHIIPLLQLILLREFICKSVKNIQDLTSYKANYNDYLVEFIDSNIDTDENDFIKAEKKVCKKIKTEISKPVYNEIRGLLNTITTQPCSFKKDLSNSIDKRLKFLKNRLSEIKENKLAHSETKTPKQTETEAPQQIKYNSSQFNKYTFNLFEYLVDSYKETKDNQKTYINIWYFLKRDFKDERIMFNLTQGTYKDFIKNKYSISISKFEKSKYDYEETQLGYLRNIAKTYNEINRQV